MSPARRQEFLTLYDEKATERYIFELQKEILFYCQIECDS